jgi:2,4-dienoyl-CoA reductase-like NADH-dependent reductase (Old Yellow Enzyme family)
VPRAAQVAVTSEFASLFEPVSLGPVEVRNRIVMLSHSTLFAEQGRPSDRHRHYYVERARGGVGLVVVESLNVQENGRAGPTTVDTFDRDAMREWRGIVAAVHAAGAAMFAQLSHFGLEAASGWTSLPLWGPSAVPSPASREVPVSMDRAALQEVQQAFADGAVASCEAGFDGVELKVCHGGLLRTFLSPYFNRRTDNYGGSTANRARFVLETIDAVRASIGSGCALGLRLSLDEGFPGGYGLDEGLELARLLAGSGRLDYFTSDLGTWQSFPLWLPPASVEPGYADHATAALKAAVGLPVVAFGRIKRPEHAVRLVRDGVADLVGMARQLLADPEWAEKVRSGRAAEIRPCVACNQECMGRALRLLPIGCVHNPAAGRERVLGAGTRRPAERSQRVVVIGGGPAGLKAAESAALGGHEVVLLERARQLGGQVALAAGAPGHREWGEIVEHLVGRIQRLRVEVRLEVDARAADTAEADVVVLATGARPGAWPFAVDAQAAVLDEWTILEGGGPRGERVVLFDLGVRFEPAAVAETLLERGNEVVWVAPTARVGNEIEPSSLTTLMQRLAEAPLERVPEHTVIDAGRGEVTLRDVLTGRTRRLDRVDAVVVVGNKVAHDPLAGQLGGVAVHAIGDCVAPRNVAVAIYEGELAGRAL